jgi:hypothetical protein
MTNIDGLGLRANAAGEPGHSGVASERNREPEGSFYALGGCPVRPVQRRAVSGDNSQPKKSIDE